MNKIKNKQMKIILSPAKRLNFKEQPITNEDSQPVFLDEAETLVSKLRDFSKQELMELMDINHEIAELNKERFLTWKRPFNTKNAKQAVLAFNGDVYRGLDAESLSEKELLFAQQHLFILSGLYGILRPLDLIQPYRLEMGISIMIEENKDLYEFWADKINSLINKELGKNKVLVNLASNEYYKAIVPKKIKGDIITPIFKQIKDDKVKMVPIHAKKARGLMTRYIIKNRIEDPEGMKHFDLEGYFFDEKLSTENEWVFTR